MRYIILITACTAAFVVHLGIFEPDLMEARNFVTAREILQNDQWLLPTMNGSLRLEKPPFPTWLSALSVSAFGESVFFLRLPAALIAMMLVIYFFLLAKEMFRSEEKALIASLILVTCPTMLEMGRTGSWDIFCQAFLMGAVFYLYKGLQGGPKASANLLAGGIFIGLSSMSKGPVAIYGMLIPFLVSYFIVYGFSGVKNRKAAFFSSIVLALILSTWWYLYARLAVPDASVAVAEKEINAWANRHEKPFWFYLHFPVFTGIWCVLVVASFFYKYFKKRLENFNHYKLLLFWTLTGVLLLSVVPEKKERYLLPVIPPMALMAGMILNYLKTVLNNKEKESRPDRVIFYIFSGVILLAVAGLPSVAFIILFFDGYLSMIQWVVYAVACVLLSLYLLKNIRRKNIIQVASGGVVAILLTLLFILPAIPEFNYKNPEFRDISEIREQEWYSKYKIYSTDLDLNLKAIWRIGKPVELVNGHEYEFPEKDFVIIASKDPRGQINKKFANTLEAKDLGTYDYYRKKSKYKLYIVEFHARQK